MEPRRHRLVITALGLALIALVVLVAVVYPEGDTATLPAPLESVSPAPGSVAVDPVEVVIDLAIGYEISLVVDGIPVPADEVRGVPATGVFRWRPGGVIPAWGPGPHTVEVSWDRPDGLPDPGAFAWTFRVT